VLFRSVGEHDHCVRGPEAADDFGQIGLVDVDRDLTLPTLARPTQIVEAAVEQVQRSFGIEPVVEPAQQGCAVTAAHVRSDDLDRIGQSPGYERLVPESDRVTDENAALSPGQSAGSYQGAQDRLSQSRSWARARIGAVRREHLLLPLVLTVMLAAGCGGGTKTYSAEKSRACLVARGRVVTEPPTSDLVASAAEGGAFSIRFGRNLATVSFGTDRDGAERIVRAYQRFRGKNIGLLDVLHAERNAVLLWAIHPEDADVKVIEDCLV